MYGDGGFQGMTEARLPLEAWLIERTRRNQRDRIKLNRLLCVRK